MAAAAKASSVVVHPPASPFAALLRRSRFASYDPAIGQVYTSHDGNASRGNYGLKRPLPLRRRHGFVTVHTVDSKEQQTEFNHAESRARFVRRWEEAGGPPQLSSESSWNKSPGKAGKFDWVLDSEFAPLPDTREAEEREKRKAYASAGVEATPIADVVYKGSVPNIQAMSPKQFERYLIKLRSLRPQFQKFIQDEAVARENASLSQQKMHILASEPMNIHRDFLVKQTGDWLKLPTSRNLEQVPHRTGGLSYSHPSQLQMLLTTRSQPGLLLQQVSPAGDRGARDTKIGNNDVFLVSFAGITTMLRRVTADGKVPLINPTKIDGINRETARHSTGLYRLLPNPRLLGVPKVVGRLQQGTKAARIEAEVVVDDQPAFSIDNPYIPGSRQYIACSNSDSASDGLLWRKQFHRSSGWDRKGLRRKTGDGVPLVNKLQNILQPL